MLPLPNISEHILLAGHAQKRAHSTSRWKSRFIVLTPTHLHWFKRQRNDPTLFGQELGSVELKAVSSATKSQPGEGSGVGWHYFSVEAIEEAGYATAPFLRNFRMEVMRDRNAWVKAINQAMKGETPKVSDQSSDLSGQNVYPTMLTRGRKILCEVGDLPVKAGWDSKGFEVRRSKEAQRIPFRDVCSQLPAVSNIMTLVAVRTQKRLRALVLQRPEGQPRVQAR